jgi:hypothetical protein
VAVAARAGITECLQQGEAFASETSFCEQCFHACQILLEEHLSSVPLELIGQVYGVKRGTIFDHWRDYKARRNEHFYLKFALGGIDFHTIDRRFNLG